MFRLARIDRQFRRFLRTGDARALGVVFDATAPELFRIGAYLAGDRQQAEDLVQSTFLVALERRAEFDTRRPVMPWLCGIVTNLARAERRRARRQARPVESTAEVDPTASAEMAEFRAEFVRARDGLAAPYRSVLELHLDHGLRAHEIARVLDRPAGTVRAQITRGLDLLRKRLPRGFIAGVLIAAVAPSALAAVRAAVLARAQATMVQSALANSALTKAAVTGLAGALMGAAIMNKKLVVAGVIAASLFALSLWFANGAPADLATTPEQASAAPVKARLTEAHDAVVLPAEPSRSVPPANLANADIPKGAGRIEVTVRWQSDGVPAAGQSMEVVCAGDPLAETRPRRALTDPAGRCVLEKIPAGSATVFASTGDRQQLTVEEGKTAAVAFELSSWGIVRGVVVDAHDEPVPDADVWVSSEIWYGPLKRGNRPGRGQHGSFTMRTDAAGRFETRLAVLQSLSAAKRGHGPSPLIYPCSGKAPPDGIDVTLQLTAEGGALIVEVRSPLGAPVADAHVLVGPEVPYLLGDSIPRRATPPALRRNTDVRGIAELAPLPTGTLPVQVRATGFAPWLGNHEVRPSSTARLLVLLEAAATVYGVVTDDAGAPVQHALVSDGSLPQLRSSSCMTDEAGRFELRSLPSGKLELTASKEGVGTCTTELVVASGARYAWDPLLSFRPAITGVVLGVDGKPAVGAHVFCSNSGSGDDSVIGTTDASGRFIMGPLKQDGSYSVTAEIVHESQGALRVSQRGVPPEAELVLRIVPGVDRTARLRGRLLEANGTPATQVYMSVQPRGGGSREDGDVYGHYLEVAQNGVFDTEPSEPGRIQLVVLRHGVVLADLGEHDLHPHQTVDLGDIHLPTPGGAVLHITGGDVVNGVVDLFRDAQSMGGRLIEGPQVQWDTLPPGDYRVCVRRGGSKPLVGAGAFTVSGGSIARVELAVQSAHRCPLRFSVEGVCGRTGTLIAEDASGREVLCAYMERPPNGEAVPVLLPEGRLRLKFRTNDGWTGEVLATIPTSAAIDITLTK